MAARLGFSGGRTIPSARRYERKASESGMRRALGVMARYLDKSALIYLVNHLVHTVDANNGTSNAICDSEWLEGMEAF